MDHQYIPQIFYSKQRNVSALKLYDANTSYSTRFLLLDNSFIIIISLFLLQNLLDNKQTKNMYLLGINRTSILYSCSIKDGTSKHVQLHVYTELDF